MQNATHHHAPANAPQMGQNDLTLIGLAQEFLRQEKRSDRAIEIAYRRWGYLSFEDSPLAEAGQQAFDRQDKIIEEMNVTPADTIHGLEAKLHIFHHTTNDRTADRFEQLGHTAFEDVQRMAWET